MVQELVGYNTATQLVEFHRSTLFIYHNFYDWLWKDIRDKRFNLSKNGTVLEVKSASNLKKLLIIGDFVVTATLAPFWIVLSSDSAASQEAPCYPSV